MNKRVVLAVFLAVFLSSSMFRIVFIVPVKSHPADIIVPDDYEKIQWAIGNASDGDTIFVKAGTYYEHVVVNKSVSLIGVDRSTTIIDGGGVGTVVDVSANNVSISGFTIRNAGYQPILGIGYWSGVLVIGSDNIISNNIVSNGDRGISLFGAKGNTIDNNTVSNNKWYGIDLYGSSENMISNNIVTSNGYGIFFYVGSIGNKANNNTMSKNGVGICFEYARRNTLRNNNLTGNTYSLKMGLGIVLEDFNQDIDTSNLVNGKPICYLVKQENVMIDSSTFPNGVGYLGIVGSRNVTAKDFSISGGYQGVFLAYATNSTVQNISVSNCYYGARLFESTWSTITGCNLSSHEGVFLEASSNGNSIFNNTMLNSGFGIELYFDVAGNILSNNRISGPVFGITSYTCHNNIATENVVSYCSSGISLGGYKNIVSGNNVSYCEYAGVDVRGSDTLVSGNLLTHNGKGIWVMKGDNNIIVGNTLLFNSQGFDVRYCHNNTFYRNNVVNNTIQAYLVDTINEWDNGYPSGGNYWSDYSDVDLYSGPYQNEAGSDGIWDHSYVIDGNNQDNYPLMKPWGPIKTVFNVTWNEEIYPVTVVSNSTVTDFNFSQPLKQISFNVTGPNGSTEFCNVTIPKVLLRCESPEDWQIKIDDTLIIDFIVTENETHTSLYFTYTHTTHEVQIVGTMVIGEEEKVLLGVGWGWMRIEPRRYFWGRAELYRLEGTQIELAIMYKGEEYSRTWSIIRYWNITRKYWYRQVHMQIYFCYSEEWGYVAVRISDWVWWCSWSLFGRGVWAFGFTWAYRWLYYWWY